MCSVSESPTTEDLQLVIDLFTRAKALPWWKWRQRDRLRREAINHILATFPH